MKNENIGYKEVIETPLSTEEEEEITKEVEKLFS